ncbi:hypothetical protein chiPu_0021178 [Chiloscyllium punctatum]|uniref:Uncharacterized protein n=1 Tax=Chiloscyllium punctatum TaxID=137246 RepID=A0A401RP38_CHIPU|nr:hypothetical protein [Chiloscyllium punctatum]
MCLYRADPDTESLLCAENAHFVFFTFDALSAPGHVKNIMYSSGKLKYHLPFVTDLAIVIGNITPTLEMSVPINVTLSINQNAAEILSSFPGKALSSDEGNKAEVYAIITQHLTHLEDAAQMMAADAVTQGELKVVSDIQGIACVATIVLRGSRSGMDADHLENKYKVKPRLVSDVLTISISGFKKGKLSTAVSLQFTQSEVRYSLLYRH